MTIVILQAHVIAKSDCAVIALANHELRTIFRKDTPFEVSLFVLVWLFSLVLTFIP